ncbi:hypothetical protein [Anaerosporobacter sp.]
MKVARIENIDAPLEDKMDCISRACQVISKKFQFPAALLSCYNWKIDRKVYINDIKGFQIRSIFSQTSEILQCLGVNIIHNNDDFIYAFKEIEGQLYQNKEVVLCIDAYYCPWNPAFKLGHMKHYIIPLKIDYDKGVIDCYEPFHQPGYRELLIDNFRQGYINSYVFEKKYSISEIDPYGFCQSIMNEPEERMQQIYGEFITFIGSVTAFEELYESSRVELCSVTNLASRCYQNRFIVARVLESFFYELKDLRIRDWCNDFIKSLDTWNQIYLILLKMYYLGSIRKDIIQIVMEELQICMEIEWNLSRKILMSQEEKICGTNIRN